MERKRRYKANIRGPAKRSRRGKELAELERDNAEKIREQQESHREVTYNNLNDAEEERISKWKW